MIDQIGWVGNILFAACGIPQVIKCYRDGNADGLSWIFLLMWLVGEIFTASFVWNTSRQPQLMFNYIFNTTCLLIILKYKLFPIKKG